MQGCVARAIQTVLSTINRIFKKEKRFAELEKSGIPKKQKIDNSQKSANWGKKKVCRFPLIRGKITRMFMA